MNQPLETPAFETPQRIVRPKIGKSNWPRRFGLLYLAAGLAILLCSGTGLIPEWGKWYSSSLPHRMQTDALLRGELALSQSPADTEFDLIWTKGAVQQAWGLGVAFWRLPFEAAARLAGQSAFPDRVAFAIALAALIYCLFQTLLPASTVGRSKFLVVLGILLLAAHPPMITFFRGIFSCYEEPVAYGYLLSVGLFAGVVSTCHKPRFGMYCLICTLAGITGFVRPTMLAYGIASVVILFFRSRAASWSLVRSLTGPVLFAGLGAVLLWTNVVRFGSPMEFGHHLQLNLMYELRFDSAFAHEPFWSAARELFGSIFFVQRLNGLNCLDAGVVAWQSATSRWRLFYGTTFNAAYLAAVLGFWSITAKGWFQKARPKESVWTSVTAIAALWSLLSIAPLAFFYLRTVAMSSRYVLDFAPAIAVAISALIWRIAAVGAVRNNRLVTAGLAILVVIGWFAEISTAKTIFSPGEVYDRQTLEREYAPRTASSPALPATYFAEDMPQTYGLFHNREGWRNASGETGPLVILFVNEPGKIHLRVAPDPDARVTREDWQCIKVKAGLEFLPLISTESEDEVRNLTFGAPTREEYRHGIQVLFLGLAGPTDFVTGKSKFKLLSVSSETMAPSGR